MENLTESVKAYLRDKISSPYLFSCIAFFVGINRKMVYGLFNFQEELTVDERIQWIHDQLTNVKVFGILPSYGFYGQIFYSIFGGFFLMVLAERFTYFGKKWHIILRRSTINGLKKVEPDNWIASEKFEELKDLTEDLQKRSDLLETDATGLRNQINELKGEQTTLNKLYEDVKAENFKLEEKVKWEGKRKKFDQFELENLEKELTNKSFPAEGIAVILGVYGSDSHFKNITDSINKKLEWVGTIAKFVVSNELDGDPAPGERKRLNLWYISDGLILKETFNEGEKVFLS